MVFVVIGWVTLSLLFCIAFCCAAARRQPRPGEVTLEATLQESPAVKNRACIPDTVLLAKPVAERPVSVSALVTQL
jgi:hypothetical protein